ncbi:tyrosine-type recombinase/integrase [Neorhizobium galegae]|uniref:tyrosine-type recombinase/integrase n=1 Tax=Neorhizobium galegae TaxID=399 RepID=UPI000628265F|nr:tyrosine-type recombinase/integrase [Neorhizobium galegae]KAB1126138.1 tyrosine-type recombinase/integrase [Neorhizobium galegae]MCQ1805105.1 tyrosine-type recombinase/integrase [Neorhizobium galegae]
MTQRTTLSDPDRHLSQRNGYYTYKRRVPAKVSAIDSRFPTIRIALGTRDLGEARIKRDAHERADDELWASLYEGGNELAAFSRYKAVVARAVAVGFRYRHLSAILVEESGADIVSRLRALQDVKPASQEETAILGGIAAPGVPLRQALSIYVQEIAADELSGKSKAQYKRWLQKQERAVTTFEDVCGQRCIEDITREDARLYYNWWKAKIVPNRKGEIEGEAPQTNATHTASSGNRNIGILRTLYRRYFEHLNGDEKDGRTPFDKFSFSDKRKKGKKKRPHFPTEWIVDRILAVGALAGMNDEARAIVLVIVETGCRVSEVADLRPDQIRLSGNIPYLMIEPCEDPDDPVEIKTEASVREIPLVGVALEAIKKFPKGFPRYRHKGSSLSGTQNKYFKENGLCPTDRHVIYSLRHSFEDRMINAKIDVEVRKILMGHAIDRPEYGDGGGLGLKRDELARMALPYDPSIV